MAGLHNVLGLGDRTSSDILPVAESTSASSPSSSVTSMEAARRHSWSRRKVLLAALGMWGATRVAYALITYMSVTLTTSVRAASGSNIGYDQGYLAHSGHEMLNAWMRWDAQWYVSIAQHGYFENQATAFFPLFPLSIKTVSLVIGPHWALAGLIASNLGSLVGFIGVGLLAARELDGLHGSRRAMLLMAAYPLAFFLTAPYTDGLFLGLAALALYCARASSWKCAAAFACLAGLTRPTGVILILPLIWEFGRQHEWWRTFRADTAGEGLKASVRQRWTELRLKVLTWASSGRTGRGQLLDLCLLVAAVPFALAIFAVVCRISVGHFLIFLHAQHIYWNRNTIPLWDTIGSSFGQLFALPMFSFWQMRLLVDLCPLVLVVVLTVVAIRRIPFAFTLYMVGLVYLTVASPVTVRLEPDPLFSAGRFFIAAAPMYILLAGWCRNRSWLETLLLSCGFAAQALLGAYFLIGGWMV